MKDNGPGPRPGTEVEVEARGCGGAEAVGTEAEGQRSGGPRPGTEVEIEAGGCGGGPGDATTEAGIGGYGRRFQALEFAPNQRFAQTLELNRVAV